MFCTITKCGNTECKTIKRAADTVGVHWKSCEGSRLSNHATIKNESRKCEIVKTVIFAGDTFVALLQKLIHHYHVQFYVPDVDSTRNKICACFYTSMQHEFCMKNMQINTCTTNISIFTKPK